jgi:hypothetical protein
MSLYFPSRLFFPLVLALALPFLACERGLAPQVEQEGREAVVPAGLHLDPEAGLRFPVPSGLLVETERYPGVTEPGVIRHMVTLTDQDTEVLRVELWDNATRTPLAAWFDAHLSFMRDGLARVTWGPVAPAQVRGMTFTWPRSGQSTGQRIVLFALGDRVIRVTCQNWQDPALLRGFTALVSGLSLTERRP